MTTEQREWLAFFIFAILLAATPMSIVWYVQRYCTTPTVITSVGTCSEEMECLVEYSHGGTGIEYRPRVGDRVSAPATCRDFDL